MEYVSTEESKKEWSEECIKEFRRLKRKLGKTQLLEYICPECKSPNKPSFHSKTGYAIMRCEKCGALYRSSTKVSLSFRKLCSSVGSKPTRSPTFYTSLEEKVKRFLFRRGLKEGLDFFHNSRIGPFTNERGNKVYYWCDFVIPQMRLIIEVSPKVWHKIGDRESSDARKNKILKDLGWKVIHLDGNDIKQLNKRRKAKKYPKTKKCLEIYDLFKCKEEYVR